MRFITLYKGSPLEITMEHIIVYCSKKTGLPPLSMRRDWHLYLLIYLLIYRFQRFIALGKSALCCCAPHASNFLQERFKVLSFIQLRQFHALIANLIDCNFQLLISYLFVSLPTLALLLTHIVNYLVFNHVFILFILRALVDFNRVDLHQVLPLYVCTSVPLKMMVPPQCVLRGFK